MKAIRSLAVVLLMLVAQLATSASNAAPSSTGTAPNAAAAGWNVTMVDNTTSPKTGWRPSIAMHPVTQQPYVSYHDVTAGALRLATRDAPGTGSCGTWGWNCVELDNVGRAGDASSLRFVPGGNGAYAIAYTDPDHADVKLRQVAADGATTTTNVVYALEDEGKGPADGGNDLVNTPALAFRDNQPFIAFYRSFRQVRIDGDTRNSGIEVRPVGSGSSGADERIDSDEDQVSDHGLFASIDIDEPSDDFRVAYREQANQTLKYAQPVASGGTGCFSVDGQGQDPNQYMRCDLVDPAPKTGAYITLSAPHTLPGGGKNATQIAYYDATNGRVKYAKFVGGNSTCGGGGAQGWQCVVIDNVGTPINNGAMGVSMVLDGTGSPVIAYYDRNDTDHGVLKVARPVVGNDTGNCGPSGGLFPTWQCTLVDDGGANGDDVGQWAAITLDSTGKAYVAYFNSSFQALMVAHEKSDAVPQFTASYNPSTVQNGASTTLTYTLKHSNPYFGLSGLAFTHNLIAHSFVPNTLQTTCGSPQISFLLDNHAIRLTSATLKPNSTCTITVTVQIEDDNAGNTNTTALKSNEANDGAAAQASLTVLGPNTPVPTATPVTPTTAVPPPTPTTPGAPTSTPTTGNPNEPTSTPTTGNPGNPTSTPTTGNSNNPTPTSGSPAPYRLYLPFVRR